MFENEADNKRASSMFMSQSGFLKGEILTIIEASVLDERQCKAVKDLVHGAFTNRVRYVDKICGGHNSVQVIGLKDRQDSASSNHLVAAPAPAPLDPAAVVLN